MSLSPACMLRAVAGPSSLTKVAVTRRAPTVQAARTLYLTRPRRYAAVSGPSAEDVVDSTPSGDTNEETPGQRARNSNAPPDERRSSIQAAKERKFREYESLLKRKAAEKGLKSVEELQLRVKAEKVAERMNDILPTPTSPIEERDARIAAEIRARAEAEAKKKLASGDLSSGGGKSPVKPLGEILNLDKLMEEPPDRIQALWTGYHTMKNKLSAVIPADVYKNLISTAKQYPQFVLPLPRAIDVEDTTEEATSSEKKQGYEMHFLEWGFLPSPPPPPKAGADAAASTAPTPTTVLFTPLAEYKLRQEFAQPLLILTHYTDLAASKGLVLMRGEITGVNEAEAAPTGVAAAAAAAAAGASKEEQERLAQPLQSQGRMTQQDAQLLSMCMQRFYLPDLGKGDNTRGDVGASERVELLQAFHKDPAKFDVDKLVDAAFKF